MKTNVNDLVDGATAAAEASLAGLGVHSDQVVHLRWEA